MTFTEDERKKLTTRIQNAGTEVVEAKAGKGSATLSMAYAAARMAESTLLALTGEANIYECTYVQSDVRFPHCCSTAACLPGDGAILGGPHFPWHVQNG